MSRIHGMERFAVQPSLLAQLRRALRVVSGSNISRMAAALSYRTVFGLIPVLAIGVAVLGGFATDAQVTTTVEKLLDLTGIDEIVVSPEEGATEDTGKLDEWLKALVAKVQGVSFVAIGATGAIILAYAAISFMIEIERSANHIYRAPTGRSWVRRVTQYWTTLTLGSIFLVGTFYVGEQLTGMLNTWTGTAAAGENAGGQASFGAMAAGISVSLFIDFVLLFFVYTTVPNARVNLRCAAIGAFLAAILWEAGKWGFKFVVLNSSAQTLYGAIALVPLFLLWVYITWMIVLSGLQISYVLQHFRTFAVADDVRRGPTLVDPLTLVRVAVEVARKFAVGEQAAVADVARAVGLDEHTSLTMLERLSDAKVLNRVPIGQEREVFAMARPAEEVAATELLELAGRMAESGSVGGESERLGRLRRAQLDAAAGTSLADLMGGARATAKAEPAKEPEAEPQSGLESVPGTGSEGEPEEAPGA